MKIEKLSSRNRRSLHSKFAGCGVRMSRREQQGPPKTPEHEKFFVLESATLAALEAKLAEISAKALAKGGRK